VTRESPSTDFIPLPAAAAHERAPALAERLLVRALANVIHSWPPYSEGYEQLSPELFTDFAEAGCSANEIAAWSGQSLREVERYTRAADQARLARNALARSADTTARRGIA